MQKLLRHLFHFYSNLYLIFRRRQRLYRYLNIYRKKSLSQIQQYSNSHASILCFGEKNGTVHENNTWPILLEQKLKTNVTDLCIQNTCNSDICNRILFYCRSMKPAAIYVYFPDLNILPHYNGHEMKTVHYTDLYKNDDVLLEVKTSISNYEAQQYHKTLLGFNLFLNFVRIYKCIRTYCEAHNIKFYWFADFKEIRILNNQHFKKFFNENKNTFKLSKDNKQEQIAKYFADKTL